MLLIFLLYCNLLPTFAQVALNPKDLKPDQLKPAMLYWDYGAPEYLTIESIYPHQDSTNSYWNVTHRSPVIDESTGNGFDYYLIEAKSVRPVLSHMYHSGFVNYKIEFSKEQANLDIKRPTDSIAYQLELPNYVAPEGPGTPIFLGSLPLQENYDIEFYELNRWNGTPPRTGQLDRTRLKVMGTETVQIEGQSLETYKLNITSEQGRFTEVWALKAAPHYWVKVHHKIDEKRTMKSKVVKLLMLEG